MLALGFSFGVLAALLILTVGLAWKKWTLTREDGHAPMFDGPISSTPKGKRRIVARTEEDEWRREQDRAKRI